MKFHKVGSERSFAQMYSPQVKGESNRYRIMIKMEDNDNSMGRNNRSNKIIEEQ